MNDRTCDVCGKEFSKPSAMRAHKRWKHEGHHPTAVMTPDIRVELAEYRALKADVEVLRGDMEALARKLAGSSPVAAPAVMGEHKTSEGGHPWLFLLAMLGAALWANSEAGKDWVAARRP